MKALRFEQFGTPDVLVHRDIPVPALNAGEVLVKVHAAAINPSDVKIVSGLFGGSVPRTPGRDFAGVVVEGVLAGKDVWGSGAGFGFRRDGAHAEYVVLPASWLSEKPAGLSMVEAAAVGAPFITAWHALVDVGSLKAGETLLITGGLGAVGRAAIQIARHLGARTIVAARGKAVSEADETIDISKKDLPEAVRALTWGKGADVVLDAVGGPLFEPALKSLALGGRQLVITSVGQKRVEFDLADFYHNRSKLLGVDTAKLTGEEIAGLLDKLKVAFDGASFKKPPVRPWRFDQAADAYRSTATGEAAEKNVLVMP
ncbi:MULTISPECIES: quinone oxidoreductase family protein [Rhizobium]|uniref:NADPH:quinone reductase n=1 Tax=Rhizobium miluonense TaxID=411945 RepID=A0A1C3WRI0_9HYPH|nr:zinc-binding alcohol dehydrogenase family protein [Rhizobium miluonense]SCB42570.1 NADPH:quinone reductase [Rhizobium miluonense]